MDLVLNNLLMLICNEIQTNQSGKIYRIYYMTLVFRLIVLFSLVPDFTQ